MTTNRTEPATTAGPAARGEAGLHSAAVVAAVVAAAAAPLLTLAYLRTAEGAQYASQPTIAAWADPARRLLGPLLTFASADAVYTTWTLVLVLAFPVVPVAAVRFGRGRAWRRRRARVAWLAAVAGYCLFAVAAVTAASAMVAAGPASAAVNAAFLAGMLPGLLLSLLASTALGVGLLRDGCRGAGAWLLALAVPGWVVGSLVLGHNSLGLLPLFAAWAALSRPRSG